VARVSPAERAEQLSRRAQSFDRRFHED